MRGAGWHRRTRYTPCETQGEVGRKTGELRVLGTALPGSGREREVVGDLSTRNHLRVSPERRALSPNRSPAAPEHRKVQGHRLRCGAGRTHSGLGSNEPEPPRPPPPAAVAAASAKPSFGHHAAASQHVGRGRCQNPGGRLEATRDRVRHKGNGTGGPPWPFRPNADRGSRNRGNVGPSRSQRRFTGSLSRHPLRYRKPLLQAPSLPDQVPEVTAPFPHPRLPAHPRGLHFLPPRSRAFPGPWPGGRAPRGPGAPSTRLLAAAARDSAWRAVGVKQLTPQTYS